MHKNILFVLLISLLSLQGKAQGVTYTIDLNKPASISQNLTALAKAETNFWASVFKLDSSMYSKLQNNNYSLYMQYVNIMKVFNYKMEKILLTEQYNFKVRRRRFMKMFLNETDLKTYDGIVQNNAKKEIKNHRDKTTEEIRRMRIQAAGWNVLSHTIKFK